MFKHHEEKETITFTSEGLAVPEVHIGHAKREEDTDEPEQEVLYDTVAIPEFRPSVEKHKADK